MSEKYLPDVLEIKYKDSEGLQKSIKQINNQILINNPNPELIEINKIDKEKWLEFWDSIESLSVWNLEEEYRGCSLEGGFVWSIHISLDNREINSYGANVEPKTVHGNQVLSVLDELFKSVEILIEYD